MRALLAGLLIGLAALPAAAVNPDEMLADPALEARARALSKDLRCLQCRNESIDESNAGFARDMRLLLRERIAAGDTDAEAMAYLTDRFGDYILLMPPARGANWLLYAAGPALLLAGLGLGAGYLAHRRSAGDAAAPLSAAEQARLDELTRD
jgi:cytochrome c-type biogenesis protein CcmH